MSSSTVEAGMTGPAQGYSPGVDPAGRRRELLERLDASLAASARRSLADAEARLRRDASDALERAEQEGADARLTPAQVSALEAIAMADGSRPLLFVRDDDVDLDQCPISPYWREALALRRDQVRGVIRSVGRIGLHPEATPHAGTGWVIGDDLIATNLHVLGAIGRAVPSGWELGEECCIDFIGESGRDMRKAFRITGVARVPDQPDGPLDGTGGLDIALLRVTPFSRGLRLPPPLDMPSGPGPCDAGRSIYLVGYPGKPLIAGPGGVPTPGSEHAEVLDALMGNVFDVKRLSLGRIVRGPTRPGEGWGSMYHDASTLGGSSGAPVVDLDGNGRQVLAIHTSGQVRERNRAVLSTAVGLLLPASSLVGCVDDAE